MNMQATSKEVVSVVWMEAEHFQDLGGWTNDAQFIDQMGSPYLMAIGLGKPVEDAVRRVAIPKAGQYRLWVRCRDWVPEHSPGRFQVILNGKTVAHTFGESKRDGWVWEDGGTHDLGSEEIEVRLHDLTGYYGRCDVLVLMDELIWQPPDDKTALATLRERYGGVSREEKDFQQYDVVVVGGGLGGCLAGVSAARLGCRVALIQNRPILGGNGSTECLVPPHGVWPYGEQDPLDPKETGILEAIRTHGRQTDEAAEVYSDRLLRLCQAESNLDLYLNTHVPGVEMKSADTIGAIRALEVTTGQRLVFPACIVIDCTGDGSVAAAAGAQFRHGREPASMYDENELFAPREGDSHTMGGGLKHISKERSHPVPFEAPSWATKFPNCSDFQPRAHPRANWAVNSQWAIEVGGMRNTIDDAEEIRDHLLRLHYGVWDHAKNHCLELKEKATNRELIWVSHVLAKRESRRIMGDYVMTEHDVVKETLFPDRIAYGSWGCDVHPPDMFYTKRFVVTHFYKGWFTYSVPFRSLYSKDINNLMMAGRNTSVSHVALGAVRSMFVCALEGQTVGTAARLCLQYDTTPRGVYKEHITELQQQLLKDGCYLIDLPNSDPRDLARTASVRASSSVPNMGPEHVIDGFAHIDHGERHAWQPGPRQPLPQWVELDFGKLVPFNCVHVSFQTKEHAADSFRIKVWGNNQWQTAVEVAGNTQRRRVICFDRKTSSKLRLVLAKGRDNMAVCEIRVYDEAVE